MSNKTQHTPGPWWWDDGKDTEQPKLMAPSGKVCDFGDREQYYPTAGQPPSDADASLIAESPVLLAVVEEAIRLYGKPGGPWNVPSDPGGWIARAQDAVAKARGTMARTGSERSEGES